MNIYVISSPTENYLFLTCDERLLEQIKKEGAEDGAILNILEWDTSQSPAFPIEIRYPKRLPTPATYVPPGGYHA